MIWIGVLLAFLDCSQRTARCPSGAVLENERTLFGWFPAMQANMADTGDTVFSCVQNINHSCAPNTFWNTTTMQCEA